MSKGRIIAIDGVSGSGKSTLAKELSKILNFMYLDTGAMYRAITLHVIRKDVDINDEKAVTETAGECDITVEKTSDGMKIFVNGSDVSGEIRKPYVAEHVSQVSLIHGVREYLVECQRKIASDTDIVVEGRDIGTVVFPDADAKLFLDASIDERAQRRCDELMEKNISVTLEEVKNNISQRDTIDSQRECSPLIQAEDAFLINSTNVSIDEKTEIALGFIREKFGLSE